MDLKALLTAIAEPRNRADYEAAWSRFLERYLSYMEAKVRKRVYGYHLNRLPLHSESAIDDALGEVLIILCRDNARALREFRNPDQEYMFLSWLSTICRNTTSRYLRRHFNNAVVAEEEGQFAATPAEESADPDEFWEVYEDVVRQLRGARQTSSERDIHIFLLYTFAQFDRDTIQSLPCLSQIGHRVVDNAVNRRRAILRELHGR